MADYEIGVTRAGSTTRPHDWPDGEAETRITGVRMLVAVLRKRHTVVFSALGLAAVVALITLLQPRTYTASASFSPESRSGTRSALSGIAAQFGFQLSDGVASESPDFYASVVESRDILQTLADSTYSPFVDTGRANASLAELLEVDEEDPDARLDAVVAKLREIITPSVDVQTGAVQVTATTNSRSLSIELLARILALVNSFNLERRQSRAAAEADFVAGRLQVATAELSASEKALQIFLEQNRTISASSELRFQHDRLQRDVTTRQQIVVSLQEAHESARIERVRNTPVVTVVEAPYATQRPDRRRLVTKTVFGLAMGATIAVAVVISGVISDSRRQRQPDDFEELDRVRAEMIENARRMIRLPIGRSAGDQEPEADETHRQRGDG